MARCKAKMKRRRKEEKKKLNIKYRKLNWPLGRNLELLVKKNKILIYIQILKLV